MVETKSDIVDEIPLLSAKVSTKTLTS